MTVGKHDPAPWAVVEYGDGETPALVIHKDTQNRVCFMATPGSNGDPAAIEANARLIAAAPDMLANHKENARILRFLVNELQGRVEAGKLAAVMGCLDRSNAAIAKATGA